MASSAPSRPLCSSWLALSLSTCASLGLCAHTLVDAGGWKRRSRLRGELAALQAQNDGARLQAAAMAEQIEALRTDGEAQERAARHELGWVRGPRELVVQLGPQKPE